MRARISRERCFKKTSARESTVVGTKCIGLAKRSIPNVPFQELSRQLSGIHTGHSEHI